MASKSKYIDESRLCCAVDTSRHVMQFFREERMRGVRHFAGSRYSQSGAQKKTYVNFISLYCNIVGRNLFSKTPRVSLSTFDQSSKAVVAAMETWINQEIEDTTFADTMQRVVLDALFAVGVSKVALATPSDSAVAGWQLPPGSPFLSRVDLDDFVYDHHARDFSEVSYMGHRFRAPLEVVRDSPLYNKKARDRLTASEHERYNRQGDERIGAIGDTYQGYDDEFEEMVDLWEIYLPRHKKVYTFTEDDLSGPDSGWDGKAICLRSQDWLGPETGPYHILAFQYIPGNPFPKGPVLDIVELHEALNESYRKLVRQAAAQKDITVCQQQNSEDGIRIKNSRDQDILPLNDPKSVQTVSMNGVNQGQALIMREFFERASLMCGNLITMGGLAPQAGTLGQEELLATQSNGQVASMQDATAAHVNSVSRALLWYWWHDPRRVMRTKYQVPGMPGLDVPQDIHPWNHPDEMALRRVGEMPRMKIDPYSMRYVPPAARAQQLVELITKVFIPMAPLAQQQGIVLDYNALWDILSKHLDQPDLQTILTFAEPPQQETESPSTHGTTMPAETTRNYNRRSLGGESSQAQGADMETMLESGNGKMNGQLAQL